MLFPTSSVTTATDTAMLRVVMAAVEGLSSSLIRFMSFSDGLISVTRALRALQSKSLISSPCAFPSLSSLESAMAQRTGASAPLQHYSTTQSRACRLDMMLFIYHHHRRGRHTQRTYIHEN